MEGHSHKPERNSLLQDVRNHQSTRGKIDHKNLQSTEPPKYSTIKWVITLRRKMTIGQYHTWITFRGYTDR